MVHDVSPVKMFYISGHVAFDWRGRSLSYVCRCFPKVPLGHQHAPGDEEENEKVN